MLTILIAVSLPVLIVLAIPLTLDYEVSWTGVWKGELRLHWLFGLFQLRIPACSISARHKNKVQKKAKNSHSRNKHQKTSSVARMTRLTRFVMRADVKHRISRFFQSLWQSIDKRNVKLRLRLGLGDPADTGLLWVMLGPAAAFLNNIRDTSVILEPEFHDSTLDIESSGAIKFIPLQSIWLIISFVLSPVLWLAFFRSRH